jgi:hypothetical protein
MIMKRDVLTALILVSSICFEIQMVRAASVNGLCIAEPDFVNLTSMSLQQIRDFLTTHNSFMRNSFTDVDGTITVDAALEIYNAATANGINPQVVLATLQKESSAVTMPSRSHNDILMCLAGWGANCKTTSNAGEQIQKVAEQLRRDFDRVARCETTLGGWENDSNHATGSTVNNVFYPEYDTSGSAMSATPENKAVAALYQYTPWVGTGLGGGRRQPSALPTVGGNGLFCSVWSRFNFEPTSPAPLAIRRAPAILQCTPNNPSPTASKCANVNASGGTPPYSWTTNKPTNPKEPGAFTLQVTGVHQQNARFRPPVNSGGYPGVKAYAIGGISKACGDTSNVCAGGQTTQSCSGSPFGYGFGCNDQYLQ